MSDYVKLIETPVSIRTEKSTPKNAQKEDSPAAG